MENKFYVYAIFSSQSSNEARYFGKGSGDRVVATLKPRKTNNHKNNFLRANPNAFAEIIADNLTESQAFKLEEKLIAEGRARGLNLVNSTDGGEGVSGRVGEGPHAVFSPEEHSDICHPIGSPRRAVSVILYHFETKESCEFPSVNKAAEFVSKILEIPKEKIQGSLNLTKNKAQPSIYGFSAFLSEDFTKEEIHNREFAKEIATKKKRKLIQQFDKITGLLIKEYISAHQAARETKINRGNICSCCNGQRRTTGGFIWKFSSED